MTPGTVLFVILATVSFSSLLFCLLFYVLAKCIEPTDDRSDNNKE